MLAAFAAWCRTATAAEFWGLMSIVIVGALLALGLALQRLARARFLEDLPPSRVRSAAQGYVELQGHARLMPGPEIVSPLSGTRCVWWSYTVEEQQTDGSDGEIRRSWETIERETSDDLFLLSDTTGDCIVDPLDATVQPGLSRSWRGYQPRPGAIPPTTPAWSSGPYRYSERLLKVGDFLFAAGWFHTLGAQHDFDEKRDVGELLADWKRDRSALLRRFDADRNGDIDAAEWEAARQAALEEVRARHLDEAAHPDLDVLGKPPDRRPFILSTRSQARLAGGQRIDAAFALLAFVVAAGLLGSALHWRGLH